MWRQRMADYSELTKPRIYTMVLVTAAFGYVLASGGLTPWALFGWMLLGTGMSSAGASVLNNVLERDADARMDRTKNRPLPTGRISPTSAVIFGVVLSAGGPGVLAWQTNYLAAGLALASVLLYVLVYTPLKRYTWWNTPVGAVPGAIPPMIGWAAASGNLGAGAWVLFFILFLWQHPHFYAIAWMFRDDYRRGGFKMLPVVEPSGKTTFRLSLATAIILVPVSLWPTFVDITGWFYFVGALAVGVWFLAACVRWRLTEASIDARKVLRVSVVYLPALLVFILIDFLLIKGP